MSPGFFCYDDFSTDSIEFPLRRGAKPSQSVHKKKGIRESSPFPSPPNFLNLAFPYENKGFHNLRTPKREVNKIRRKSVAGEKDGIK